jgi:hypothetical protein
MVAHGGPSRKKEVCIYTYISIYIYIDICMCIHIYIYTGQLAIKFDDPGKLELLKDEIKILQIYPPNFYLFLGWDP